MQAATNARNRDTTLAWSIAALMRAKKLPKLDKMIEKPAKARRKKKPMDWKAMLAVAERLAGKKT